MHQLIHMNENRISVEIVLFKNVTCCNFEKLYVECKNVNAYWKLVQCLCDYLLRNLTLDTKWL